MTVVVEGARILDYKTESSSVSKLTESIRDTPQAITTVMQQEMDDRAVATMNDALRSVPGITLGAGETSWQGTNLFLRGFTTRNDMFLDGMRDFGYYYRDPFNKLGHRSAQGSSLDPVRPRLHGRRHPAGEQAGSSEAARFGFAAVRLGRHSPCDARCRQRSAGVERYRRLPAQRDGPRRQGRGPRRRRERSLGDRGPARR